MRSGCLNAPPGTASTATTSDPALLPGYGRGGVAEWRAYLASFFTQNDSLENGGGFEKAEMLFTLLLGESHRQRLLGLSEAPTLTQAQAHARDVLTAFPVSQRGST